MWLTFPAGCCSLSLFGFTLEICVVSCFVSTLEREVVTAPPDKLWRRQIHLDSVEVSYLSCREKFLPPVIINTIKVSSVGQCTHITWHHMYFTQFSIQLHSGTEIYCMLQVQYGLVIPPVGGVASFNLLTAGRDRSLQILARRSRHLHIPVHSSKYLLRYLQIMNACAYM